METISISINGTKVDAKKGTTILEASQNAGIYILETRRVRIPLNHL